MGGLGDEFSFFPFGGILAYFQGRTLAAATGGMLDPKFFMNGSWKSMEGSKSWKREATSKDADFGKKTNHLSWCKPFELMYLLWKSWVIFEPAMVSVPECILSSPGGFVITTHRWLGYIGDDISYPVAYGFYHKPWHKDPFLTNQHFMEFHWWV